MTKNLPFRALSDLFTASLLVAGCAQPAPAPQPQPTAPVITHRLPLNQMAEALAAIHRREAVKVILEP
jgi:hypothetical protein